MAESKTTLVKPHLIRPFLNKGTSDLPDWIQIKYTTEFNRAMNPQTTEKQYIFAENPTTEVEGYKPSEPISIQAQQGEPDFDFFYQMYKDTPVGQDAQREMLVVHLFDKVTTSALEAQKTYYYAYKVNCTVAIEELSGTNKTLNATMYENGTAEKGYVELQQGKPVFTAGEMPPAA